MRFIPICGIALLMAASLPAQDSAYAPPSLIYRSEPEYSAEATLARVQATIMLAIVVGEDGKAREIRVTSGAGFGLDEKAIEAMTKWRFNPARRNGQPLAVPANIEMNFTILAKNDKVNRTGQRARLNFTLPANTTRPRLVAGELPANPADNSDQLLRFHLRVDADGTPKEIKPLSSTDPAWEKQVQRVVQTWRFQPAALNGNPVAVEADFEMQHIASTEPEPILVEPPAKVTTDEPAQPRAIAPRTPPPPVAIPGFIARTRHTATLLPNGTVLLAGGHKAPAQIFDWVTRHIVSTGAMTHERSDHTATLLRDGTVLIVGGYGPDPLATAEIFNPSTGTFAPTGDLHQPRYSHIAITLPDGRVLIRGGRSEDNQLLSTDEIYNPRTKTFTTADSETGPRRIPMRGRGDLYLSATVDIFDSGRFLTATLLPNGKVLITANFARLYDPASQAFKQINPPLHPEDARRTVLLNDGKVLLTYDSGYTDIFDPDTATFAPGTSIPPPGRGHATTLLQDGSVLVTGKGAELLTIN